MDRMLHDSSEEITTTYTGSRVIVSAAMSYEHVNQKIHYSSEKVATPTGSPSFQTRRWMLDVVLLWNNSARFAIEVGR